MSETSAILTLRDNKETCSMYQVLVNDIEDLKDPMTGIEYSAINLDANASLNLSGRLATIGGHRKEAFPDLEKLEVFDGGSDEGKNSIYIITHYMVYIENNKQGIWLYGILDRRD